MRCYAAWRGKQPGRRPLSARNVAAAWCATDARNEAYGRKTTKSCAWSESSGVVPSAGQRFFPLDEELGLTGSHLAPTVQEALARLGSRLTYGEAQEELRLLWGLQVSKGAIRRATLLSGQVAQEIVAAEVTRLEQEAPPAPAAPEQLVLCVDGAFVQLTSGDWREVKTVTCGEFDTHWQAGQQQVQVKTEQLSYFSRLETAEQFGRSALAEWHRRGGANAQRVVAVNDGAAWIQAFIDYHCPQATRVLDFAHAQSYLAIVGRAIFGAESAAFKQWYARVSRQLGKEPPQRILGELHWLRQKHADHPELQEIDQAIRYLETRRAMIDYPHFRRCQIPIGSGIVESGHKVVMQRRMKQAGMRWAESSVNPLLALRTILANRRWEAEWPRIYQKQRQRRRQTCRRALQPTVAPVIRLGDVAVDWASAPPPPPKRRKPAPDHPWRKDSPFQRSRRPQTHNF